MGKTFSIIAGALAVLLMLNSMRLMEIENSELKRQLHQVQTEVQFMQKVSNKLDTVLSEWDYAHKALLQQQASTMRKLEKKLEESEALTQWGNVVVPDFDLDSLLKDSVRAGQSTHPDLPPDANAVQ
jgi:hypothetical protein